MLNKTNYYLMLALAVLGLSLTACNTMAGAGQDIERAGAAVEDAAN